MKNEQQNDETTPKKHRRTDREQQRDCIKFEEVNDEKRHPMKSVK